jgi:predicted membrane protein
MDEMEGRHRYSVIAGVRYKPQFTGRVVLGLAMMAFGILWTLDNLGLVESGPILRWWPAVIVILGVLRLFGGRSWPAGAIITFVGLWLLAEQLDLIHMSFFTLWPIVLVFIGIAMLTRSSRLRPADPTHADDSAAKLSSFAFMSGVVRKVVSTEFQGGDATAMMGGVKLDLRGAKPAPGGAVLDVMVVWGGIEIWVPDTWRVVNEATVMLGGLEDQTRVPPADTHDTLIIRGLVVMAGIEIKN